MKINKNYIIIALVVLCTIMVWFNINKKDIKTGKDFDVLVDELEAKIAIQDSVIVAQGLYSDSVSAVNLILDNQYDSLTKVKQTIKIIHDKEINTLPTATDNQLDSIIRAGWSH